MPVHRKVNFCFFLCVYLGCCKFGRLVVSTGTDSSLKYLLYIEWDIILLTHSLPRNSQIYRFPL